jgi:sigma-B regulation protein RsbU (phosphoserine phosphatase)
MHCEKCQAENPTRFQHCGECGAPLYLAVLKEISDRPEIAAHYVFASGATIGRHYENSVVLLDPSISRHHARLEYQDDKFFIQDLSSSNGVYVNEVKVERREIKDFDRLTVGKVTLLFRTSSLVKMGKEHSMLTQDRFLVAIQNINQNAKSAVLSQRVLEIAAEFAITLTRAERAIIFLYDQNLKLQPAVCYNFAPKEVAHDEFEVSLSAIAEAEASGEMLMREQLLDDPRFKAHQSIQALRLNTIICLPLKSPHVVDISTAQDADTERLHAKGVLFGMLYLDSRRPLKGLPQHRKTMLQVLADQTSLAIENSILQREMQEKKSLKQQMRAAKVLQQRLFPSSSYSHHKFEMANQYVPAQQIGGDYLAFLPLSDSRFVLAIGDVVGKGLPAGLVVMTLHGGLYAEVAHQDDLLALMHNLDRLVYEYAEGKVFVTLFIGILDAENMTMEYASAGHNPPLLHRSQPEEWHELRAAGIPLGLNPETQRGVGKIQLQAGDVLTFYTDGLTEAHNAHKKQFGVEGLKRVISSWVAAQKREQHPLSALISAVLERARNFAKNKTLEDDTTIMVLAAR